MLVSPETNNLAGMPGWKAFVEPTVRSIDPAISSSDTQVTTHEEDIILVGPSRVLVPAVLVAESLQRLNTLVTSHPHPSLAKRLLGPILLPLWSLSSWEPSNDYIEDGYRKPAMNMLRTLLQLSSSSNLPSVSHNYPSTSDNLSIIVQNLMFRGRSTPRTPTWVYAKTDDGGIQIEKRNTDESNELTTFVFDLSSIDDKTASFCALISSIPDFDIEISHLFIRLCRKWLRDTKGDGSEPMVTGLETREPADYSEHRLIEAKLMQRMMTSVPEKLVNDSQQVLDLVNQILSRFNANEPNDDGNEDIIAVALSLLNIVLTSPNATSTPGSNHTLEEIQNSVDLISRKAKMDISLTAQNLLSLIKYRDALNDPNIEASNILNDQQYEDRKNYSLAISYLTSSESPPPVRVQGLELISTLLQSQSSVLDIPALVVLFSSLLQDCDEYIYLRVIKSFVELSNRHPNTVLRDLIDRYFDPNEEAELDQRLRLGEALLQVIRNVGHAFSGDVAQSVGNGLLSIAGRRGFRPKYQREQESRRLLKQKKQKEAEDAWDGSPPQLAEYLASQSKEDEILSQIISGWESKRGSEDVRIRSSALSILGSAIEGNIAGVGSSLISTAVDLCIHILTLEREPEKGILRRSAIILIMGFIRALDSARDQGIKLGFGLVGKSLDDVQRVLKYVEDTDNDGLVRQHAKDVVDGLHMWQLNALIPPQSGQSGTQELAGLTITPRGTDDTNSRMRPRIEEVE